MKIGMLWFDTRPVADAIAAAANRYFSKYGVGADTVHVHPATLGVNVLAELSNMAVIADNRILPNHYWIGQKDAEKMPERVDVVL